MHHSSPKTAPPATILIVDDVAANRETLTELLQHPGYHLAEAADGAEALRLAAETPPDLVLLDVMMPGMDGFEVCRRLRADARLGEVPIIMVTTLDDQGSRLAGIEAGADDFITKPFNRAELRARVRTITRLNRYRRLLDTQTALSESDERFRQLAEQSHEGFWFMSLNPERIEYMSPAVQEIFGSPIERFYQDPRLWMTAIHEDDQARVLEARGSCLGGQASGFEQTYRISRPDGSIRWVEDSGVRIHDHTGATNRMSGVIRDITARMELEAQFRQAQKMECVGQLASGIAHDFNNLLTVINGMSNLVLAQVGQDDSMHADVQEILHAGERAALLTRQLLAFSRRQILEPPQVLNVNTVVSGMASLLRRLLGEGIHLVLAPAPNAGRVKADPGQLEQVITNLVVNARDAMPQGGQLTIETENVTIDEGDAHRHGGAVPPGSYVRLIVSDSGIGMNEATRDRMFEPFFTTKGPGKGTGLGLSTVYGIVQQSHGFIRVDSETGHGTRFTIYLPQVTEAATTDQPAPTVVSSSGTETILLVEDNAGLRKLATRVLEPAGYTVLGVDTGEEALRLLERHETPVHLLLSDVVMPGMGGPELAEQVAQAHAEMKVLYTSGYTRDTLVQYGVLEAQVLFLNKPFTPEALLQKVREVLDSRASSVSVCNVPAARDA